MSVRIRLDQGYFSLVARLLAPWLCLCILLPLTAHASPFNCRTNHCGLLTKGNDPYLIIGNVERVADKKEMLRIFRWARAHGYWSSLPPSEKTYLKNVKILSLRVATPNQHTKRSISVLMALKEYRAGPFHIGDQVRYAPRRSHHYHGPNTASAKAYWKLIGCVDVICGVKDPTCKNHYRSGVYSHASGREINPVTGKVLAHGVRFDPMVLFSTKPTESSRDTSGRKK